MRDAHAQIKEMFDVEVSLDLINQIIHCVIEEVRDWQSRPFCPVILLDAIVSKVRDNGTVKHRAAHLAVGVDVDGRKEVLGICVEMTEAAKSGCACSTSSTSPRPAASRCPDRRLRRPRAEVRRVLYATNMIESINYQLREISRTRGHFLNDDALIKLLHLGCRDLGTERPERTAERGHWLVEDSTQPVRDHLPGRLEPT